MRCTGTRRLFGVLLLAEYTQRTATATRYKRPTMHLRSVFCVYMMVHVVHVVCVRACVGVCVSLYVRVWVCVCACIWWCVCVCVCGGVCLYVCMRVCV